MIIDRKYYPDCTISRVGCGVFQFFMLELPWRDNQVDISCIPEGTYKIKKRFSPSRGYEVLEYQDVPDRTYIQIHPGNFRHQILGCQLPGNGVRWIDGDSIPDVTNSAETFHKLMKILPDVSEVVIRS